MAEKKKVLISLKDVKMHFPIKGSRQTVKAVDGVTVDIFEGETFGLVGESGCGKSTLGRVILQLYKQTAGTVRYSSDTNTDTYSPRYLSEDISKVSHVNVKDADAIIEKFPNQLKIAGGLLLADDLGAIESALMEKYNAVRKQAELAHRVHLIEMKHDAISTSSEITDKDRAKMEELQKQIDSHAGEIERTVRISAEKEALLEKLRDANRSREGFERLEGYVDKSIDLSRLTNEEMRALRRQLQVVFQDPYSSLNPRLTVGQIISEGLIAHDMYRRGTKQMENYTLDVMSKCGLQKYMLHRYPHQFSGGQRQRIGIARALALGPRFVVCDEAVSALDVSIQSQIINLLVDLKEKDQLTYLFISHDLSAVKFISDRIGVMYLGNIIELASSDVIFREPLHPYTDALLKAIPTTDDDANKELLVIEGDIPSPINPPAGCKFHTRCPYATEKCKTELPPFTEHRPGHFAACHYPLLEDSSESEE